MIRSIANDDIAVLYEIELLAHPIPWSKSVFEQGLTRGFWGECYIDEQEPLGFYWVQSAGDEIELLNIAVSPTAQRQGVGDKLLQSLLSQAYRRGAKTIFLEVRLSNQAAIGLYEALGFGEVGQRDDYYPAASGGREHALIMALEVSTYPRETHNLFQG